MDCVDERLGGAKGDEEEEAASLGIGDLSSSRPGEPGNSDCIPPTPPFEVLAEWFNR